MDWPRKLCPLRVRDLDTGKVWEGYRDREAVEERTAITYPADRSESDE